MTALLVIVAFVNIGLLVMLMVRYQPQTGLPQPQQMPISTVNPYAGSYASVAQAPAMGQAPVMSMAPQPQSVQEAPPVFHPAMAPPPQQDLQPLYAEAARQLDRRLDRLEALIAQAEEASHHLNQQIAESHRVQFAARAGFTPGLPTREAKVRFLNNGPVGTILALADQGYSPAQIARHLGRGVDEVTLTLNLRQKMTG